MRLSKSGTRFAAPIRRLVSRRVGLMSVTCVREFCDEISELVGIADLSVQGLFVTVWESTPKDNANTEATMKPTQEIQSASLAAMTEFGVHSFSISSSAIPRWRNISQSLSRAKLVFAKSLL